MRPHADFRAGISLIELLVVLAIMAVLIGLTIPAVQVVREHANAAACANNMRQLALACHNCQSVHGRLPPAVAWFPQLSLGGGAGVGPVFFHLLPFIEQGDLYESSRRQVSPRGGEGGYFDYQNIGDRRVALFNCPSDPTLPADGGAKAVMPYAASSYAANFVVFGKVDADYRYQSGQGRASLVQSFTDGTSSTLLFGEKYAQARQEEGGCHWAYWGQPRYAAFFALDMRGQSDSDAIGPLTAADPRDSRFQWRPRANEVALSRCATGHRKGMTAAFADGSVRQLAPGIDRFCWWALVTPAAGDRAE